MNPPLDADRGAANARRTALSRWEADGGASAEPWAPPPGLPGLHGGTEAEQLRMRVIALESLVIALLADASERQRTRAAEMGELISPRPGHTPHPLTLRAAAAMRSLLQRADRFRASERG